MKMWKVTRKQIDVTSKQNEAISDSNLKRKIMFYQIYIVKGWLQGSKKLRVVRYFITLGQPLLHEKKYKRNYL